MVISPSMSESNDSECSVSNCAETPDKDSNKRKRKDGDGITTQQAAKIHKGDLYKPPTNDELHELKETQASFHSSLFKLQISELLTEVSVKVKWRAEMEDFLKQLTDQLMKAKKGTEHDLSDTTWLKKFKGIEVPMNLKPAASKGKFQFFPPKVVKTVGSFVHNTLVKPHTSADVIVEMPKECLQGKDYLNQRYLRKRALYLTHLALHLSKWSGQSGLKYTLHCGSQTKPVLEVQPEVRVKHWKLRLGSIAFSLLVVNQSQKDTGKLGTHMCVYIHVVPEQDYFKHNRFHITKNNVRRQWYTQDNSAELPVEEEDDQPATPHYNTEVLSDLTALNNSALIEACLGENKSLQQGLQLLKVWLHQRQLSQGYGSFNGFILTMFIVYLLKNRRLSAMMSNYQVVRNVLTHLSTADWCSTGLRLCEASDPNLPTLEQFHQHFSVVFVDQSGFNNLCAHMTSLTMQRVKHEACLALKFLETPGVDAFDALFIKSVSFIRKFDQIVHISKLSHLEKACESLALGDVLLDYSGDYVHASRQGLIDLLQQAVGKRLTLLDLRLTDAPKWSVTEKPPDCEQCEKLSFGFILDSDTCNSVLEKGPAADSLEAVKFRSFWGDKSELRRFQDGSICEAAVWSCKTVAEKRRVLGKIVKHILNRHCDLPRDSVTVLGSQLDDLLRLVDPRKKPKKKDLPSQPPPQAANEFVYGTGEEQHTAVFKVYDELCKELRSLQDLPLAISTIQGVSPVFRYSQVFPVLPAPFSASVFTRNGVNCPRADQPAPPFTPVIPVLCLLEASGKWPDDLEAVQRVKAAFHLQMSSLLSSVCNLVTNPFATHVDVLKEDYVFRVEVGYSKEIVLMKTVRTPEGMLKTVDTDQSRQLERKLNFIPKLTITLQSIQQRFPSYSCSVRLAKRWLSSHMFLGEYVPDEAADLIMAYIYLHPDPYQVPGGPMTGFLRFLYLFSTWDWKVQPMMVNLNDKFTAADYVDIPAQFTKQRSTLPLMFISTPEDKHTSQLTRHQPTAPILNRVAMLAQESLNVLQTQLQYTHLGVDFKQVFRPPLEVFDLVIQLHSDQVSTRHQTVDAATPDACLPYFRRHGARTHTALPVVNYNPAHIYFNQLQATFGDLALFFYDVHGGSVIGMLWKPQALKHKTFSMSHLAGHMVTTADQTAKLTPNVEAIVADMKYMGQGLVSTVQLNTENWKI